MYVLSGHYGPDFLQYVRDAVELKYICGVVLEGILFNTAKIKNVTFVL